MPAVQTAYPLRQDRGLPGGAAMSRYASDTGVVQGAPIPFGAAVQRGADARGLSVFAAGGTFLGIARQDRGVVGDSFPVGKPASYFQNGSGVFVLSEAAVTPDQQVRWNTATSRFTNAAASGTVLDCTGWLFDEAAAAGVVIVKRV